MTDEVPKDFYTPTEVARLLRVQGGKIFTWIRSGELKAFNVSASRLPRYRISKEAIDDFILIR
jgi:excisionase family DNA binding protein